MYYYYIKVSDNYNNNIVAKLFTYEYKIYVVILKTISYV